jgi:hypothetical protein
VNLGECKGEEDALTNLVCSGGRWLEREPGLVAVAQASRREVGRLRQPWGAKRRVNRGPESVDRVRIVPGDSV